MGYIKDQMKKLITDTVPKGQSSLHLMPLLKAMFSMSWWGRPLFIDPMAAYNPDSGEIEE